MRIHKAVLPFLLCFYALLSVPAQAWELDGGQDGTQIHLVLDKADGARIGALRLVRVDDKVPQTIPSRMTELFCDWPEPGIRQALQVALPAGRHAYRLEGEPREAVSVPGWRAHSLVPKGDFEAGGWWMTPAGTEAIRIQDGIGRFGTSALRVAVPTNGAGLPKAIVAGCGIGDLPLLKQRGKAPFLLRGFFWQEGTSGGMTLRLRGKGADGKWLRDWGEVKLTGDSCGKWVECRQALPQPLSEQMASLEAFLVCLNPQRGMAFRLDDIQLLPTHSLEPEYRIEAPPSECSAAEKLRFSLKRKSSGGAAVRRVVAEAIIGGVPSRLPLWLEQQDATQHGAKQQDTPLRITLRGEKGVAVADSGLLSLATGSQCSWRPSVVLPPGAYSYEVSAGQELLLAGRVQLLENPFAE